MDLLYEHDFNIDPEDKDYADVIRECQQPVLLPVDIHHFSQGKLKAS